MSRVINMQPEESEVQVADSLMLTRHERLLLSKRRSSNLSQIGNHCRHHSSASSSAMKCPLANCLHLDSCTMSLSINHRRDCGQLACADSMGRFIQTLFGNRMVPRWCRYNACTLRQYEPANNSSQVRHILVFDSRPYMVISLYMTMSKYINVHSLCFELLF